MENINSFEAIGVCIATLVTYICGQKWVLPWLSKIWNWFQERNQKQIDTLGEIQDIKLTETEYYSKTFDTLLNQIQSLEEELNNYASELEKLRTTILRLNAKLYKKSMVISQMQPMCCAREDCGMRIYCQNYIENVTDNGESVND